MAKFQLRPVIPERGIELDGPFADYIQKEKWQRFADHKHVCQGVKSWVCEFYTYLRLNKTDAVKVQGKTIDISPNAINAFYEIPEAREARGAPGYDEYLDFIKSGYDVEVVMEELTGERRGLLPNWTEIEKKWLTPKASVLNLWVNSRFHPASSHSGVRKRRALLLYALCKGYSVNVGKVINAKMHKMAQLTKDKQAIGFPSLITAMLKKAGLKLPPDTFDRTKEIKELPWKKVTQSGASSSRQAAGDEQPEDEEIDDMAALYDMVGDIQLQMGQLGDRQDAAHEAHQRDFADFRHVQEERYTAIQQQFTDMRSQSERQHEEVTRRLDDITDFMRYQAEVYAYDLGGRQGPPPVYPPSIHYHCPTSHRVLLIYRGKFLSLLVGSC